MTIKEKLQQALYRWLNEVDIVEDDIASLIDNHNISKQKIARDIGNMKDKLRYIENLLKEM